MTEQPEFSSEEAAEIVENDPALKKAEEHSDEDAATDEEARATPSDPQ
jgi:hypothetical protein